MPLWTDLVTPDEITEVARTALADREAQKGSLSAFLPSRTIDNVTAQYTRTRGGMIDAAEFRSYDAESSIGDLEGGETVTFTLPAVSRKLRISELELLLRNAGNPQDEHLKRAVNSVVERTVRAISERVELMRGEVIETAAININEGGLKLTADLGRDEKMKVDAAKKWDQDKSNPLDDLLNWVETYTDENGETPGVAIISRKTMSHLVRNDVLRKQLGNTANTPTVVTLQMVNELLAQYDLPQLVTFDRKVEHKGAKKPIFDPKNVIFLPTSQPIGETTWGAPAEATDPEYGLNAGEYGGIVTAVHRNYDPYSYWVHSNAIALPVLTNPNATMVATVLT